jgi:two-component system sensor kinase
LRTIAGFSRILQEDYSGALDSEGRRCLALVGEGVDRMERLIDDLLAFSRMSRSDMDMRIIDVGALADDVFAELRAAAPGRNIRFVRNDLPPACCDPAMLRQALTNLLSNAIKYTSRRPEALIEVSAKAGDTENVYCVKDNGVGFDMRSADKLFCAFQRLHSSSEFEGTGVGLAIVKRIVERHGGRVWAEGKVNGGAAIYFALPRGSAVTASA